MTSLRPLLFALLAAAASVAAPFAALADDPAAEELPPCPAADAPMPAAERSKCRRDWTVLVYMAADNDLAPYALWDLADMEAGYANGKRLGGSGRRSDLLVQLDLPGPGDLRRIHVFQQPGTVDPKLGLEHYRSRTADDVGSPVVERLPESGTEQARLQAFLEWGSRQYPSKRTMVVVWGHGQGWAPSQAPATPAAPRFLDPADVAGLTAGIPQATPVPGLEGGKFGGLAFNSSNGTHLDIPALRDALAAASRNARGGRPFDIYASDACLMQMLEVATEISGSARYIVGSTQLQNFLGLPYRQLMFELNTGRLGVTWKTAGLPRGAPENDEAWLFARSIPRLFKLSMTPGTVRGYQGDQMPEGIETLTMSVLSSDELGARVLPALENFSRAMTAYLDEDPDRASDVEFILQSAPTIIGGAKETSAFLTLIRIMLRAEGAAASPSDAELGMTDAALRLYREAALALRALDAATLGFALGQRYSDAGESLYLLGFKAVSTWLPSTETEYSMRIRDFTSSGFYRAVPGWAEWLKRIYAP